MRTKKIIESKNALRLGFGPRSLAFSLVEVVLSLGIVTFCSLTLIALIPEGLSSNKASREQIIALNLCRNIESDLKSTASTTNSSPLYGITIPAAASVPTTNVTTLYDSYATSANSFSTTRSSSSQYRFTVTLVGPTTSSPNDPVNAKIQATWPPSVTPVAPSSLGNPTNTIGTVNLDIAINRFGS